MPDLDFRIDGVEATRFAAEPLLTFKLHVSATNADEGPIQSVALRCQIRIEPAKRSYVPAERERLLDVFGTPERWGQTLKPMLWTHVNVQVRPFHGRVLVDLPVPCSYDFNLAATKYFDALTDGAVPLLLLFSGTIFHEDADGALRVGQIAWEKEASYALPVATWKQMMEHYYPNCAWLCLRKDVFDRLHQFKQRRGVPTWEQVVEHLLDRLPEEP